MLARADGDTLVQYAAHLLPALLDPNLKGGGEGGVGGGAIRFRLLWWGRRFLHFVFQVSESSVWRAGGNLEDTANSFDSLFIGTDVMWWRKHGGFLMVIGADK